MDCLAFDNNRIPHYADGMGRGCVGCQHCMAVCPTGALSFGGINPDELPAVSTGDPDEVLNLIRSRRSFRRYKNQDVPAEKLEKIRQMLAYPPTGANLPDLHFSIIGTKAKMDEIREATYRHVMADRSSMLYRFCHESYLRGEDMIYRGAPSMVIAAVNPLMLAAQSCEYIDPTIALSYTELYAQSLGLGNHPLCGNGSGLVYHLVVRGKLSAHQGFKTLRDVFAHVLGLDGASLHQTQHFQRFPADVVSID